MAKVKDPKVDAQIHHGRREKLRESFEKHGLHTFNETQVIEYALGFCIPRVDTNPTAHRLMNAFGSLSNVVDAHPSKLKNVEGIGHNAAYFLSFLRQFVTFYMARKPATKKIQSNADAIEYLREVMKTYATEQFVLIALDKGGNILHEDQVKGTLSRVNIELRDVVDMILRTRATAVVLAHNHPDDSASPSDCDIMFTRCIVNMLTPLNIQLIDHLIFSKTDDVFSFRDQNYLELFAREHKKYFRSKDYETMLWSDLR